MAFCVETLNVKLKDEDNNRKSLSVCAQCGSQVKVIAGIEDPGAISKILTDVKNKEAVEEKQKVTTGLPNSRAPPQMDLFKTS